MARNIFFFLFFYFSISTYSQIWEDNIYKENISFEDKLNSFKNYKKSVPYEKGKGYNPYERQIYFLESRMPKNNRFPSEILWKEWIDLKSNSKTQNNSNWVPLGPFDVPLILSNNKKRGNGRVNCIEFHPTNPDVFWVGTPGGGLWKTNDGGSTWETNTDNLPVLGVSDVIINPENTQIMYLATGDADGGDTYSIGVLKSIDGGVTWDTTGLSYGVSESVEISKLEMNPNYPDSIFAVSDNNIFVTSDGGLNWETVGPSGRWRDIHYKPGNTNILYAAKQTTGTSNVYRSTNGGSSWQLIDNGVSLIDKRRPLIAVTPANPEVVYSLFCNSVYGFHGLYKSSDGGDSWVLQSDTPNILGRETDGSDVGGQSWYDMTLSVSPINENHIYVGGINLWESTDGGVTWHIEASSGSGSNYAYMHVDHHAAEFNPLNNVEYVGNDGGIYKYVDQLNTWVDISDGLEISQFYKIGLSKNSDYTLVVGAQDNGTERLSGNLWQAIRGSDGMECVIDHYNDNIIYSTSQYGGLRVTYNGGDNWNNIKPVGYQGSWVTPYKMHELNNNILVAGYNAVYKSVNGGNTWDSISPKYGSLKTIALAPSNTDYIYAATYNGLWVTKDDGNSWSYIKTGLPSGSISDVTVCSENPDRVFVTFSGYNNNEKVYETKNGGQTWINISGYNLPNLPVNCIVYQSSNKEDLYIGTDIGVFHKDSSMSDWQWFNSGLPSVQISELEIQYSLGKIRAATYGRGVWESDLNSISTSISEAPNSNISINPNPAKNKLQISSAKNLKGLKFNLFNVTGDLFMSREINGYHNVIPISELKSGVYIVKITSERKTIKTEKLIIY